MKSNANIKNPTLKNDEKNSSTVITSFVLDRVDLFIDKNKQAFAKDKTTNEVWHLLGRQFRDWLVSGFYQENLKIIRLQSLIEALSALTGISRKINNQYDVHVRVATLNGNYYIDLGQQGNSKVVKITSNGCEIIDSPPVMFVRPDSMLALPEPDRHVGTDLELLWDICNIPDDKKILVLTYLIECLRPETPYPLLEILGEQGSAKSTTQAILRKIIDPHACDLRAAPKSVDDLFVAAGVNHLLSYENVSHLNSQIQDGLCTIATGGGFAKRKLYTDIDEIIIHAKNPVMINGISPIVTAPDLIDRTISIELPVISNRKESPALWENFSRCHGKIFGALLNIFSAALAILPSIEISPIHRPRLVEYARLGMAVSEAHGHPQSHFMEAFNQSRLEAIDRTLDDNPVVTALVDWFETRDRNAAELPLHELLKEIEKHQPHNTRDVWPKTSKSFGDTLRRVAPVLRQLGLNIKSLGKRGAYVKWQISSCESSLKSSLECLHVSQQEEMKT